MQTPRIIPRFDDEILVDTGDVGSAVISLVPPTISILLAKIGIPAIAPLFKTAAIELNC